jgi:hypothetical protein
MPTQKINKLSPNEELILEEKRTVFVNLIIDKILSLTPKEREELNRKIKLDKKKKSKNKKTFKQKN